MTDPTVTIAIPVLNEEVHLPRCLAALAAQTYPGIVEVLVVDGGSNDRTREMAARPGVTVFDNPRQIQSAALNIALEHAKGTVFVRVDGHCVVEADYVERCVEALDRTGAAMVGGGMSPVASGWKERGIAAAMSSPFGAGPARFHSGGAAGWVDTVYLGAFATDTARAAGGYAEDVGVNEDAELALRMGQLGGVWFDPAIRSTYVPRSSLRAISRQFFRYGLSRAATVRRHPRSLAVRQVAAPLLCLALVSPWRRRVGLAYAGGVAVLAMRASLSAREKLMFGLVLPTMHVSWAAGFLLGAIGVAGPVARRVPARG
jgi:glycosyltransferase involved in cell wall biosynthesis